MEQRVWIVFVKVKKMCIISILIALLISFGVVLFFAVIFSLLLQGIDEEIKND